MTEKLIVFVSCATREQAEAIAGALVGERLAACVNVLPGVRSCFVWDGKLTWSEEVLLLIKTTVARYDAMQNRVRELHSYEVPEIVAVPIEVGLDAYLKWISEAV